MEIKAFQKINPTCKHIITNPQNKNLAQHQKLKSYKHFHSFVEKTKTHNTKKKNIEVEKIINNKKSEK